MKKLFFACLMVAVPFFASDQMKKNYDNSLKFKREKDSVFYRGAEDMLSTASLISTLPLIGYSSSAVAIPVTTVSLASLVALKAMNSEEEVIGTKKGLAAAGVPVGICGVGLSVIGTPPEIAALSCLSLYTAFTVMAALKR